MSKLEVLFHREPSEELKEYLTSNLSSESMNLYFGKDNTEYDISKIDCIVGWRPDIDFLKKAEQLKLFINPGVGVQHLMGEISSYFKSNNITLLNGHGNTYFTAQHSVALLLSLMNKVTLHHQWMREGIWRRGDSYAKSIPLRYRQVGLLGYGAINTKVHKFLSGFDVDFHVLRRSWENKEENYIVKKKYESHELLDFLANIDILMIALPSTPETKSLIRKTELDLLHQNTLIVNVGRGDIIDQKLLFDKLQNKEIAGAAIDVWYDYQPEEIDGKKYPYDEFENPFHELENVILSPHRAASPFDDLERWQEVIFNLNELAKGSNQFINRVNLDLGY